MGHEKKCTEDLLAALGLQEAAAAGFDEMVLSRNKDEATRNKR
jgi:hypothetical protein